MYRILYRIMKHFMSFSYIYVSVREKIEFRNYESDFLIVDHFSIHHWWERENFLQHFILFYPWPGQVKYKLYIPTT